MNTTTVTRFGNLPAAPTVMQGAPSAPQQPAAMTPAQDVAAFSNAPAGPAAAPAIKFAGKEGKEGGFWRSVGRAFKSEKANVTATFDIRTARREAERMMKERELLPTRIRNKEKELNEKLAAFERQKDLKAGPLSALVADAGRDKAKVEGLKAEKKAALHELKSVMNELETGSLDAQERAEREDLKMGLYESITDLQNKLKEAETILERKETKVAKRKEMVDFVQLQIDVVNEQIKEGKAMLGEALDAFENAKLLHEQVKLLEDMGLNEDGELGEIKAIYMEAHSYEGEQKNAVERHLGKSLEEAVAEKRRKRATDDAINQRQNMQEIDRQLADLFAEEEEETVEKGNTQSGGA